MCSGPLEHRVANTTNRAVGNTTCAKKAASITGMRIGRNCYTIVNFAPQCTMPCPRSSSKPTGKPAGSWSICLRWRTSAAARPKSPVGSPPTSTGCAPTSRPILPACRRSSCSSPRSPAMSFSSAPARSEMPHEHGQHRRHRAPQSVAQRAAAARHQGAVATIRRTVRQGRLAGGPLPRRRRRARDRRTRPPSHRAPSRRGKAAGRKRPSIASTSRPCR
ncbi:hypothetical protein ACVWW6_008923 [Bradyrhizobium sp. USDA 3311]